MINKLLFLLALIPLLLIVPLSTEAATHTHTPTTTTTSEPAIYASENCCTVTAKPPQQPTSPSPNTSGGDTGKIKVSVCNAPVGYDCFGNKLPVTPSPSPSPVPSPTKTPANSSDNNGCPVGYYRPFPGLGNYYACQINPPDTGTKCFLPAVEDKNGRCSIPRNSPPQPNAVFDFTNGRCMNCYPGIGHNNSSTIPVNPHIGIVGNITGGGAIIGGLIK